MRMWRAFKQDGAVWASDEHFEVKSTFLCTSRNESGGLLNFISVLNVPPLLMGVQFSKQAAMPESQMLWIYQF